MQPTVGSEVGNQIPAFEVTYWFCLQVCKLLGGPFPRWIRLRWYCKSGGCYLRLVHKRHSNFRSSLWFLTQQKPVAMSWGPSSNAMGKSTWLPANSWHPIAGHVSDILGRWSCTPGKLLGDDSNLCQHLYSSLMGDPGPHLAKPFPDSWSIVSAQGNTWLGRDCHT